MIKNLDKLNKRLDVWVDQVETTTTNKFRREALSMFKFLLETTPQATGRAVANWRVGINTPNKGWNPNLGDEQQIVERKDGTGSYKKWTTYRAAGDPEWINHALRYQGYKFKAAKRGDKNAHDRLQLGDRVYFSNSVQGDDDDGKSSTFYLDSLQDPKYWKEKLRAVNMPYITVAEALLLHSWNAFADGGANYLDDYI